MRYRERANHSIEVEAYRRSDPDGGRYYIKLDYVDASGFKDIIVDCGEFEQKYELIPNQPRWVEFRTLGVE